MHFLIESITISAREVYITEVTDDIEHQMVTVHLSNMMYIGQKASLIMSFM